MNFVVDTIARGYRAVHADLRTALQALDQDALAWEPAPETNGIAVLVVHLLGSEGEVWRIVAGVPSERDRSAEFVPHALTRDDLLRRIDAADQLLDELAPQVSDADLHAVRERGEREPQTGLTWLVTNYGHAREHLAQLQLTAQLYGGRR